jgi:predicted RNA binding protein YcfA (HicA-like mRNA interferase family)
MPKLLSSKEIIRILEHHGFVSISLRGSHAKYRRGSATVIVPTPKKEIPLGTLRSIIRQAGIGENAFLSQAENNSYGKHTILSRRRNDLNRYETQLIHHHHSYL